MEEKRPTVLVSNILYLISVLLLISLSYFFKYNFVEKSNNLSLLFYIKVIVTEFGVVMLPALIYLIYNKIDIPKVIRLNKLRISQVFLIIGLSISGYIVVVFFNYIWTLMLWSFGGKLTQAAIPQMSSGRDVLLGVIMIAGTAAIAEEFLFRGVIMRGYEHFGKKAAIIISGTLFGIMHMQAQSILATVFLGILIGYITYTTDSIFAGSVYHFTNNTIAVLLSYSYSGKIGSSQVTTLSSIPLAYRIAAFGMLGFLAMVALGVFIALLHKLKVTSVKTGDTGLEVAAKNEKVKKWYFIPLIIGVTIVVLMYLLDLLRIFGTI